MSAISGRGGQPSGAPAGRNRALHLAAGAIAVAGQLVVGFYTVTAIGLIGVPLWAALLLIVAWGLGAGVTVWLARRRPLLAPVAPIVGVLVLWGVVAVGGAWFGWTA